jgi:hypothetical protein
MVDRVKMSGFKKFQKIDPSDPNKNDIGKISTYLENNYNRLNKLSKLYNKKIYQAANQTYLGDVLEKYSKLVDLKEQQALEKINNKVFWQNLSIVFDHFFHDQ